MANNQTLLLLVCILHLVIGTVWCQEKGFEVIFSIPRLYKYPRGGKPPHVMITTKSSVPISASLKIPGESDFQSSVTVSRYEFAGITLPKTIRLERGDGIQTDKTIIVKSSAPVSVHAMDNNYGNHDGFLALPTTQLGTQYYVASYTPWARYSSRFPSSFCVTALGERTQMYIKTRSGQEHEIVLSAYESFRFDGDDGEDLTGTLVETDKPVAVVSGILTEVPEGFGADGLIEQLLPVHSWGQSFILSPFLERNSGYIYRVLTANNPVTLEISNVGTIQLSADDAFYEGDVSSGDTMVSIKANNPVMVVQYMKGFNADNAGDPSMVLVPSIDLCTNDVTFPVFAPVTLNRMAYYANVVIDCKYASGLVFDDNTSMKDWNKLTTKDKSMCSVRGRVTEGVHNVRHSDPSAKFYIHVYRRATCRRCQGSYAYLAGIQTLVPATTCYSCTYVTVNGVVGDWDINCRNNPELTVDPTRACTTDCFEIQYSLIDNKGVSVTFADRRCYNDDDLEFGLSALKPETCIKNQEFVDLVAATGTFDHIKGSVCRCSGSNCNNKHWSSSIELTDPNLSTCYKPTEGITKWRSGSRCYKYFESLVSWTDAEGYCQDMGGHLASITSSEDLEYVIKLIGRPGECPGEQTWLGVNDRDIEGIWRNSDGSDAWTPKSDDSSLWFGDRFEQNYEGSSSWAMENSTPWLDNKIRQTRDGSNAWTPTNTSPLGVWNTDNIESGGSNEKDCVEINFTERRGQLNDISCDDLKHFVCEISA